MNEKAINTWSTENLIFGIILDCSTTMLAHNSVIQITEKRQKAILYKYLPLFVATLIFQDNIVGCHTSVYHILAKLLLDLSD